MNVTVLITVVYLICNLFIWWRSFKWFRLCHSMFHSKWFTACYAILYILLATLLISSNYVSFPEIKDGMKYIGHLWSGVLSYAMLFTVIGLVITFCIRAAGAIETTKSNGFRIVRGSIIAICVIGLSTYATIHAGQLVTTNYKVNVNKSCGNREQLKVALIADTHLGYSTGYKHIKKMVEQLNQAKPDIVCFAGDIFDNDYNAIAEPGNLMEELGKIRSRYGVYACYGNHDIATSFTEGLDTGNRDQMKPDTDMKQFLKRSKIKIMEDDVLLIDKDFYLIGRRDFAYPGTKNSKRKTIEQLTEKIDKKKPIILMEHEPMDLQENANNGIDLDLSGHTHQGQVFPGNYVISLFWENSYGHVKKDEMHSIVTSGVGMWGPSMRSASTGEIVLITVNFKGHGN